MYIYLRDVPYSSDEPLLMHFRAVPYKMDEPMLMNFGDAPSVALFGQICPKRTGTTLLGPRRVIPSCFRVFPGPFRPDLPETDWDDTPGPKRVIPSCFGVLPGPFSAGFARNGLG